MASSRQLAAIMFADIAGYTSIMQEDEVLALQLRFKLQKKLEEGVKTHHGRLLELRGDGALCSFSSTLEAVRAALELQLDMQSSPLVPLRIGLHTGDVIVDGNSIYGDGVNIASRMESFALPGSILVSGRVQDDIKNQKEIQTVSLGKYALKNVKDPVEIFAISNPGIKIPGKAGLTGKGEKVQQKCVMVLPFINMSNDPEQEYFNDGLTEELISNLTRINGLRVISRTTSMKYKGSKKDLKTIGIETEANYIVEGSVRKQDKNLRITAQFVDAGSDVHIWAESYKGTMDDIFDIQEKVAGKIVDALRVHLTSDEQSFLKKRHTENTEAYQLYLQGRYFWKKRNETALRSAIKHFEKALKKDPDYALAWAGIADTYSLMGEYTNISRRELYPKTVDAVHKALAIDSQLAEAHISLAITLMLNEWNWAKSEREFRIGLELKPNYATGHHWYAEWLLYMGRTEEAYREINLAVELDPVSQGILKDKGIHYYYTRQYQLAVEVAKKTLELDPDFASAHRLASLAYEQMGMFDEAILENQRWGRGTGNETKTWIALAQIDATAGKKEEARKILNAIGEEMVLGGNDYRSVALVYAAMDDKDNAFAWLEKSYKRKEESLCSLTVDPKWDPIKTDSRFIALVKKVGLDRP